MEGSVLKEKINPLQFFDDLIIKDGINQLKYEFLPHPEDSSIHFDKLKNLKTHLDFSPIDGSPGELITEDFVEDFLRSRFTKEVINTRKLILDYCFMHPDNGSYLKHVSINLDFLLKAADRKLKPAEAMEYKKVLVYLKNHLAEVYGKPFLQISGTSRRPKSFGLKPETNEAILQQLHFELNKIEPNGFIDSNKTSARDFVSILTSKNLESVNEKIHLTCEITQAAFIFKKISPLFRNFSFSDIGKSMIFIRKGKIILESNLYPASSRTPQPKDYKKIEEIFNHI